MQDLTMLNEDISNTLFPHCDKSMSAIKTKMLWKNLNPLNLNLLWSQLSCCIVTYEITELGLCYSVKQQRLCYYVTVNCNKLVPVLSNLSKTLISFEHIKDCEGNT